jgi:hypothetical protein
MRLIIQCKRGELAVGIMPGGNVASMGRFRYRLDSRPVEEGPGNRSEDSRAVIVANIPDLHISMSKAAGHRDSLRRLLGALRAQQLEFQPLVGEAENAEAVTSNI